VQISELIAVSKTIAETVSKTKDSTNKILPEDHLKDNPDNELHDIQESTNIGSLTENVVNKPFTSAFDDSKLSIKDLKRGKKVESKAQNKMDTGRGRGQLCQGEGFLGGRDGGAEACACHSHGQTLLKKKYYYFSHADLFQAKRVLLFKVFLFF
jgi:hypothetical protein